MFTRRFVLVAATLLFLSVTAVGDQNIPTAICNDNRTTAGTLAHSVLQIHLEARKAVWYPNGSDAAHLLVSAFGEEGHGPQIPGPLLRVPMGAEVSATTRNSLDHTIYIHGLAPRPDMSTQTTATDGSVNHGRRRSHTGGSSRGRPAGSFQTRRGWQLLLLGVE